jgi:excinuclease ABC subunit C
MSEPKDALLEKVRSLPEDPGVYRFLNADNKIIYIGKAKHLRKRVSSYFTRGQGHSYRIGSMVRLIAEIEYTITNSEIEALLLENNLIKTHQPRYNILLKDGKTYPYICIKKERFPRVYATRNKDHDGSTYYGPYPSVTTMKTILDLIRGFVSIRTCTFDLSEKNIKAGKFKPCLEYQLGNCLAPCVGKQSEEDYLTGIEQVRNILRGKLGPVLRRLEELMKQAAAAYEFEKAAFYKNKLDKVRAYQSKTTVVSEKLNDLEVLTIDSEGTLAVVNHFKLVNGAIVGTHAYEMRRSNQEEDQEILAATLARMVAEEEELFAEIVSNIELDPEAIPDGFSLNVPQRGDKKHLVELSQKNARMLLTEKLYSQNFKQRKTREQLMMEDLQQALGLESLPDHIECFDNSNFQGTSPVAACVVFKNGKPSKKDYRKFNIKTVEGPNDFASMTEIVGRRYRRVLDEGQPLPKLIVIDGGKGQLSAAVEALQALDLYGNLPIIGIAKRLEEIYKPADPFPLHIDKKNTGLHLVQQLRDEAHRFAITFHRQKRSQANGQRSNLTHIKGIGPAAEKEILMTFKSIKKLKAASDAEREAKLGSHRAALIKEAMAAGKL